MKAFLLSAGLGTRLKPMTNTIPKCMVPINNIPLIEYWLALFKLNNIEDVFINTHYLSKIIEDYFKQNKTDLNIILLHENYLLGSLGTLIKNIDLYINEESILICYSDNLTNFNLRKFVSFHNSHTFPISMSLFQAPNPQECGIVSLSKDNTVIDFEEKPKSPKGNNANAGIYIIDTQIIQRLNKNWDGNEILDIGNDLLPIMINEIKGYFINSYLLDIGTINNYTQANYFVTKNRKLFLHVE